MFQWLKKLFGKKPTPSVAAIVAAPTPVEPTKVLTTTFAPPSRHVSTIEGAILRDRYQSPAPAPRSISAYKANRPPAPAPYYHAPAVYERRTEVVHHQDDTLSTLLILNALSHTHHDSPAPAPSYECAAPSPAYESPAPSPSYESPSPSPSDSYSSSCDSSSSSGSSDW